VFIAVEKTAPYAVAVYELDATALAAGNELRQRDLRMIADCRATSEWPGYGDDCQTLSLPSWALRNESAITSEDF
jgi:exodeoxyribonuclease VIII